MSLYTFIFLYQGGTFISQNEANDLYAACTTWVTKLDYNVLKMNANLIKKLKKELRQETPSSIDGLINSWFVGLDLGEDFGYLNIIKTEKKI